MNFAVPFKFYIIFGSRLLLKTKFGKNVKSCLVIYIILTFHMYNKIHNVRLCYKLYLYVPKQNIHETQNINLYRKKKAFLIVKLKTL